MTYKRKRHMGLILLAPGICFIYYGCFAPGSPQTGETGIRSLTLELQDGSGRKVDSLEPGKSLMVGARGLKSHQTYRLELRDQAGQVVSFYQMTADKKGRIEPTPLWYHSGIVGCGLSTANTGRPCQFRTMDEARKALAQQSFELSVRSREGSEISRHSLPVARPDTPKMPFFYFSRGSGALMNRYVEGRDTVYLTGRNVPPGSTVQIFLVPNRYAWRPGMPLRDVRPRFLKEPHLVRLKNNRDAFTEPLWSADSTGVGAYDAVVRVNRSDRSPKLWRTDIVTYTLDTGMVVQQLPENDSPGAGNFDIAGRLDRYDGYPYFRYSDAFEVGEPLWGVVDPLMVAGNHTTGDYAAFYVIPHGSAASRLSDVTEGLEIIPVKGGCFHFCMARLWNSPRKGKYDIVVDFGSAAPSTGQWQSDRFFNRGIDLIDRADEVGAIVLKDPAGDGPFTVNAYSYQPQTSGASDPLRTDVSMYFNTPDESVSDNMDKVPLRGVGYYPAGAGPFPLVLVVHGNHTPGHPSHEGYDYLCRLLAEHGFIAVSIDENFLNGRVSGEMDARAVVILRHLQLWRRWNRNRQHTFYGKVDFNRIGLCGHSRGGEAVTAAYLFNKTLHNATDYYHNFGFKIKAVCALSPVDGQVGTGYDGTPIRIDDADYLVLHGSHDGDVFTFEGQKTYDRAFPEAASARGFKALVWVYGANHNYWNTVWASFGNDASRVDSSLQQIGEAQQQAIARVYVSAFFQLALLNHEYAKALKTLFTGDISFTTLPARVTLVHQYSDRRRFDLNHYEEDHDPRTGSYPGVTNSTLRLNPLKDRDISGTWSWDTCTLSNPYFCWNQTSAVIVGWRTASAGYVIHLPPTIDRLTDTYPYLTLRLGQVHENPSSLNQAGQDKDLSIQLEVKASAYSGLTQALNVSSLAKLPYPVPTDLNLGKCRQKDVTKSVMKTIRIPLQRFITHVREAGLPNIVSIKFRFDQSFTGLMVMDDIQLSQ